MTIDATPYRRTDPDQRSTASGRRRVRPTPKTLSAALAALAIAVAAAVFSTENSSADAVEAQILPGAPIGPPYYVDISHEGQLAIGAGYAAAPGVIICIVVGTGASCAVTPAIVAFITPIVQEAIVCPDESVRRIEVQNRLVPPRPGGIRSEVIQTVNSNTCVPAQ